MDKTQDAIDKAVMAERMACAKVADLPSGAEGIETADERAASIAYAIRHRALAVMFNPE